MPWGSHFCQFYRTKQDLLDVLVPYFRAGLENNEFCVWVTSRGLREEDARRALEDAVPGFESCSTTGQIEFIPLNRWQSQGRKSGRAVLSALDRAIGAGFDGLRLACDAVPDRDGGKGYISCGTDAIGSNNVIAAISYPRDEFDALGLMEVVKNHRFALVHNAGRWEIIESSEARTVKDELKRSEEKFRSLFSNMSEGFAYHRIVLDERGKPTDYIFLQVNDAFGRLTGLKGKHIIGKRATVALPGIEKDPASWIARYGKVALTGKPTQFESFSETLKRWYFVSAFSPHKGYFAVTFSDITERKRAEEALRESEQRYATTLASIGDAVIAADMDGRITFLNPVAERLTGWSFADAVTRPVPEVFRIVNEFTRETVEDPAAKVLKLGMIVGLANHTILVKKDGAEIPIDDSGAPIKNRKGEMTGVVLVFRDITERKRMEDALRTSLADKDILMRELAHRTKNNMQVIGSLLGLQAADSADGKFMRAVSDTQQRIRAMSLVHENLYQSGNIASLDIKDYVEDLMSSLLRAHQVAGRVIRSNVDVDKLFLSIDAALPCGLIINELVSNSLKHAFQAGKSGDIFLSLRRTTDNVELRYRDDGPGLPRDLDLSKVKSLGLKLVYNLAVRQLRGTMEIRHGSQTEFVFTFGEMTAVGG